MEIVHNYISSFWKTIIAFYDENVYCLDEDGYLSYDFYKEGEMAPEAYTVHDLTGQVVQ